MNLFQNNLYKNEFIITKYKRIDSDGGGFTLLASSDDYSLNAESASDELISAIKQHGGDDVADGYSVQVV
ncbi:TPA: hypothetical protein ACHTYT_005231 [Klebsiella pneumoniae]|uniref:hypothetical protein n=1 Tax=Klebsiella pneumoniae TaxID=573 RepID=UPI002730E068|nr:hypothetical protein [Klebsiella pneumoniae]MDP1164429.1 hypothetical protein [Klebsiella pneumoniae]